MVILSFLMKYLRSVFCLKTFIEAMPGNVGKHKFKWPIRSSRSARELTKVVKKHLLLKSKHSKIADHQHNEIDEPVHLHLLIQKESWWTGTWRGAKQHLQRVNLHLMHVFLFREVFQPKQRGESSQLGASLFRQVYWWFRCSRSLFAKFMLSLLKWWWTVLVKKESI